jgi:hypothetical protein
MKNSKVKRVLTLLVVVSLLVSSLAATAGAVPDKTQKHWAQDKAEKFFERGVISKVDIAELDQYMTRARFVEIINNYFKFEDTTEIDLTDVPDGSSFKLQIKKAVAAGYIVGYPDHTFRPNNYITRQEAAVIIAKLMKFSMTEGNELSEFADADEVPEWSWGPVNAMIRHRILKGYAGKVLGLKRYLTEAEIFSLLDNLDKYIAETETTPKIASLTLTNGTIKVNFIRSVTGLEIGDFDWSAKLDDEDYDLDDMDFSASTNTFTFDAIEKTDSAQTLKVTVKADSDEITGSATATIRIPVLGATESEPTATEVSISGNPRVGRTLKGHYTYDDEEEDEEGISTFQWYMADDDDGLHKAAIIGATSLSYTLKSADAGKYLSFEVVPVAKTGETGTLTGDPEESEPLYIYENGTDILTFKLVSEIADATINATNHTVSIVVAHGTVLTALVPTITVSDEAVIAPESNDTVNFTHPVEYVVTAEDGTKQVWTVTVTEAD